MPIVKAYAGSVTVRGSSQWHSKPFYYESVPAFGETKGTFLDNLVAIAIRSAKESYYWSEKNKPEGYLPADEYWEVLIDCPLDFQPQIVKPFMSFSEIITNAMELREVTISNIAGNFADRKKVQLREIVTPPARDFWDIFQSSKSANFPDQEYFSELSLYGYNGSQLDEMLTTAKSEGYLQPKKRLRIQWK